MTTGNPDTDPAAQPPGRRAAIVTGGSRGIGLAIAERLTGMGFSVTLAARSRDQLAAAAGKLRTAGADVLTVETDLADSGAADALVETHTSHFGRLDSLIVNAGTGTVADLQDVARHRVERTIDVNLRSPLLLVRAALPALTKAGTTHGNCWVVLLSSITGKYPPPGYAVYGATKAAIVSLARSINTESSRNGVRAVALCPGYVDTDMTGWIRGSVPAEAMLPVSDIAHTVGYLLQLSNNAVVNELVITRAGTSLTEP